MKSDGSQPEAEFNDRQEIEEILNLLDRTTTWFWWNTVVTIVLLMAAMAVLFAPGLVTRFHFLQHLSPTAISGALLGLASILKIQSLYRQYHFKLFRERLAEQMQITVKGAEKFYGLATIDPLTGLYNRRLGEESLQKEIARAEKNDNDLAIIVIDLDYFKEVNDRFGHAGGDLVLKEFARHLRRAIRLCDLPIRIGGDEFLVVLPDCSRDNVEMIMSRLKPFEVLLNQQKVTVSYSRGQAQYQVGDNLQIIIQRADKVLYAAKAARSTATTA